MLLSSASRAHSGLLEVVHLAPVRAGVGKLDIILLSPASRAHSALLEVVHFAPARAGMYGLDI